MALPTGPAVTFLFTDIEGSTRLERALGAFPDRVPRAETSPIDVPPRAAKCVPIGRYSPVRSSVLASAAFFLTDSMPPFAAAFVV